MFAAVDFKNNKLAIYDSDDGAIEWYSPSEVKDIIKNYKLEIYGVILDEHCNPMFTLDGLKVNLLYKFHKNTVIDHFRIVILDKGDYWGSTFSTKIERPTVYIFDMSTSLSKLQYPSGQYITSYYAEILLEHTDGYGLQLDASVDSWKISARGMKELKEFLKYQLKL